MSNKNYLLDSRKQRAIIVIHCITNFMRHIINISLPKAMADEVRAEVKAGRFASTSEFFRHIMRERATRKLLREIQQSRKEFAAGKGKVLTSLKDLD